MTVDLLSQLQSIESDEEREWVVLKMSLDSLPFRIRQAIWAASVPHWFDHIYLNYLLDENDELDATEFTALVKLSFIETFPNYGFNIHDRSRTLLRTQLWQNDPPRYRLLSQRSAGYALLQDQNDLMWRVEYLYQALMANEPKAIHNFASQVLKWQKTFEYEKIETLLNPTLVAAINGRLTGDAAGWVYYSQASLDIVYNRSFSAKIYLDSALRYKLADLNLRAHCIKALGDANQMIHEYPMARGLYEEALSFYQQVSDRQGEAHCIKSLGDVLQMQEVYSTARQRYEEALSIFHQLRDQHGKANCIKAIGDLHRTQGHYKEARDTYEEALSIYQQIGDRLDEAKCIEALSILHQMEGEHDVAHERDKEAQFVYQQVSNPAGEANYLQALGKLQTIPNEHRIEQALQIVSSEVGEDLANAIQPIVYINWQRGRIRHYISKNRGANEYEYIFRMANVYELDHSYLESLQDKKKEESWIPLFEKIRQWSYAFLGRWHLDEATRMGYTLEIAQEAGLQISRAHYPYDCEFDAWACRITQYISSKYMQRHVPPAIMNEEDFSEIDFSLNEVSPTHEIETKFANRQLLLNAIAQLSESHRTVILGFYFEGIPLPRLASDKNINVNAIYKRHFDALKQLRKILEESET